MRLAVGSDERTALTDVVVAELQRRLMTVELYGALAPGQDSRWPVVAQAVAERVASGACQQGVLFCWTGTGMSIAANKSPGVRAALCTDAETARDARAYNDANVLCLSLRLTSEALAKQILEQWLSARVDETERENIRMVRELDALHRPSEVH